MSDSLPPALIVQLLLRFRKQQPHRRGNSWIGSSSFHWARLGKPEVERTESEFCQDPENSPDLAFVARWRAGCSSVARRSRRSVIASSIMAMSCVRRNEEAAPRETEERTSSGGVNLKSTMPQLQAAQLLALK